MEKKLVRSTSNQKLGGVCAGLANYFGLDVQMVRIAAVLLACLASAGFWAYVIAWLVIPPDDRPV